jgi:hypothetical protein
MRRPALILVLAALMTSQAMAASKPAPTTTVADARDPATLIAVLAGLGAKAEIAKPPTPGKVQVDVQTPGGGFGLQFVECDATGKVCRGVVFSTAFDRKGATPTQVNAFNRRSAVCRGYLGDDFRPSLVYSALLSPRLNAEDLKQHVGVWQGCLGDFSAFTTDPTAYLLAGER